jgi:hypothetical protein
MKYVDEMGSGVMIYVPNIQIMLRLLYLNNLRGWKVGFTDGRYL